MAILLLLKPSFIEVPLPGLRRSERDGEL